MATFRIFLSLTRQSSRSLTAPADFSRWAAYSAYRNLQTSKKFIDEVYSEPKDKIPSTYLLAIRHMTEDYPFLKEYTKEIGGIIVFQRRAPFMSMGGSIAQILCVAIGIFSIVEFYPFKLIWSAIFFFIFGYLGSRFNKKAMMKEMSKVFAKSWRIQKNQ